MRGRRLILMTLLLLAPLAARAQWTQAPGPGGGSVRAITLHPEGALVALQYDRLFGFRESSGRWQQLVNRGAMRLDEIDGSIVATTDEGMMRSTDAGTSWSPVGPTGAMAVDESDGRIYAVDNERLHRSTDGGASWQRFADLSPNVLAVATADPVVLVAVDQEPGVVRSTDGGASWRIVSEGLPDGAWPVIMRRVGASVYASFRSRHPHRNHGIYRSLDSGRSWSPYNEGLPVLESGNYPWFLRLSSAGEHLYATSTQGVFALASGRWTRISTEIALASDADESSLVIGTGTGVARYEWATGMWSPLNDGLTAMDINAVLGAGDATLAASGAGIHRTSDGGATWSLANVGRVVELVDAGSALLARADPYDSTSILRSLDGGRTWSAATTGLIDPRWAVSRLAATPVAAYVGLHEIAGLPGGGIEWRAGGVFRSTDGGASWSPASTGLPRSVDVPAPIVHLAAHDRTVIAATAGGLYRSIDMGSTWVSSPWDLSNGFVSSLTEHAGSFYLTAGSRIYRSTNAGASWSAFDDGASANGTDGFHSFGQALVAHSRYTTPARFHLLDGERWVDVTSRMPQNVAVADIAVAGTRLAIGTHDAGVWYGALDEISGIESPANGLAISAQAHPNPARDRAQLRLQLDAPATLSLDLVDAEGRSRQYRELGRLEAGEHLITLDLADLPPGAYRYRLVSDEGRIIAGGIVRQ